MKREDMRVGMAVEFKRCADRKWHPGKIHQIPDEERHPIGIIMDVPGGGWVWPKDHQIRLPGTAGKEPPDAIIERGRGRGVH